MAETWTGVISDSRCGAKHTTASVADVKCMQSCLKKGAVPVLVSNGKAYNIETNSNDKVTPFLGQKVTITGKIESQPYEGTFITVESVSKAN